MPKSLRSQAGSFSAHPALRGTFPVNSQTVFRHIGAMLSHVGYMASPCLRGAHRCCMAEPCLRSSARRDLYSVHPSIGYPCREDTAFKGRSSLTLRKRWIRHGSAAVQHDQNPTWNAISKKCESASFYFVRKLRVAIKACNV